MIKIRASSLAGLFDCPARWAAVHIDGIKSPSSGAAQLGTAVHAGAAVFDQARIDAAGITADDAAGAVVDAIWRPAEDVAWDDIAPREAERVGLRLHARYCAWAGSRAPFAAVELACGELEIADLGITLTGTTDRIYISDAGEYGIADIKTGKRAVSSAGVVATASHAAQLGVYELLAENATGEAMAAPARIIGASTTTGALAVSGDLIACRELLVGDGDQPGLLQHAAAIIKNGLFYGNPRSQLCSDRYCPAFATCKYRR